MKFIKPTFRLGGSKTFIKYGHLLICRDKVPKKFSLVCFILMELQMISVILQTTLKYLDPPSLEGSNIVNILNQFIILNDANSNLSFSFPFSKIVFFVIQFYTWICIFIAFFLLFLSLQSLQIAPSFKRILMYISYLQTKVLIFPIISFNLATIKRLYDNNTQVYNEKLVDFALCIVSLTWNIIFVSTILFIFTTPLKTRNPLSVKTKVVTAFELILKCFLQIIYLFEKESEFKVWLLVILSLFGIISSKFLFFERLPFYKIMWLKMKCYFYGLTITLSILNIVGWIIQQNTNTLNKNNFVIATWILLAPVLGKTLHNHLDKILLQICSNPLQVNEWKALHFLAICKSFIYEQGSKSYKNVFEELVIAGMKKFIQCKNTKSGEYIEFDFRKTAHLIEFYQYYMLNLLKKHNKFMPLRLFYFDFVLNTRRAFLDIFYLIREAKTKKLCATEKLILLSFMEDIKDLLKDQKDDVNSKNLNFNEYIRFEQKSNEFRTKLLQQIDYQQHMWKLCLKQNYDFEPVFYQGQAIKNMRTEINKIWHTEFENTSSRASKVFLLYGLYLELVNNQPIQSKEILQKYLLRSMKNAPSDCNGLTDESIYQSDTYVLTGSAEKKNLGKLLSIPKGFLEEYKYTEDEILGQNVKFLMPAFFGEKHDNILKNFSELGGAPKVLGKIRELFILKKGYLKPVLLYLRLNPLIETSINFVAIIRPIKNDSEYILVRKSGYIDALSEKIALKFGTNCKKHLSIFDLCQNFEKILEVFNKYAAQNLKLQEEILVEFNSNITKKRLTSSTVFDTSPNRDEKTYENHQLTSDSDRFLLTSTTSRYDLPSKIPLPQLKINLVEMEALSEAVSERIYKIFKNSGDVIITPLDQKEVRLNCKIKIQTIFVQSEWAHVLIFERIDFLDEFSPPSFNEIEELSPTGRKGFIEDFSSEGNFYTEIENIEPIGISRYNFFKEDSEGSIDKDFDPGRKQFRRTNNISAKLNTVPTNLLKEEKQISRSQSYLKEAYYYMMPKKQMMADMILTENFRNAKGDDISGRSRANNYLRTNKTLELCLHLPYQKPIFKVLKYFFIFCVIVGISIFISQTFYTLKSYERVKKDRESIYIIYGLLGSACQVSQDLRELAHANEGMFGENSTLYYKQFANNLHVSSSYFHQVMTYIDLSLGGLDRWAIDMIFNSNISLTDTNTKHMNVFTATARLYNDAVKIYNSKKEPTIPGSNKEINTLIDNFFEDYIQTVENFTLENRYYHTIAGQNYKDVNAKITFLGLIILASFTLISLLFFKESSYSIANFIKYYERISDEENEFCIQMLEKFKCSLIQEFQDIPLRLEVRKMRRELSYFEGKKRAKNLTTHKSINSKNFILNTLVSLAKLWPTLIMFIAFLVTNFMVSNDGIEKLNALVLQNSMIHEIKHNVTIAYLLSIDSVTHHGQPIFRGRPVRVAAEEIYYIIGNVYFTLNLFRTDKFKPDEYQAVMHNISCSNPVLLFSPEETDLCKRSSGGSGFISIVMAASYLEKKGREYLSNWDDRSISGLTAQDAVKTHYTSLKLDSSFAKKIVELLLKINVDIFDRSFAEEDTKMKIILIIGGLIDIIAAIYVISRILVKLCNLDDQLKDLFRIIPLELITKNRWLRAYMVETSGKYADSMKRYLN